MQGNEFGEIGLARFTLVLKQGLEYTLASIFNLNIFPNVCHCIICASISEHGFQQY